MFGRSKQAAAVAPAREVASAVPLNGGSSAAAPALPTETHSLVGIARSAFNGYGARLLGTAKYVTQTEVHTYAFSVAANAILSFFPFVVLLLSVMRHVFHSQAMFDALLNLIRDNLPISQDFIVRNLKVLAADHHALQVVSGFILLITSTGVFLPLEVALNAVWGFKKHRSYVLNQLVSLGLAFAVGLLVLLSVAITAGHEKIFGFLLGDNIVEHGLDFIVRKVVELIASCAIFFLIYWILPNGKVRAAAVAPAAILMGVVWELGRIVYIAALPRLNFQDVYGPFAISVTLMLWAFGSGLLLIAGAHLSAGEAQPQSR